MSFATSVNATMSLYSIVFLLLVANFDALVHFLYVTPQYLTCVGMTLHALILDPKPATVPVWGEF